MGEPMRKNSCQIACWAMGAAAGFGAFVMLLTLGDWDFIQAIFGAAVIFILLGGLLSWILCKPLPALGEIQAGMAEIDATDAPASGQGATFATSAPETAPVSAAPAEAPAAAPSAIPSAVAVAGVDPLTDDMAPSAVPPVSSAPVAPVGAVSTTGADVEAEPVAPEADRPATLSTARGGQPDNLKEIRGIGPKLETMLHGMGFFHFDQIAAWSDAELAWVDQNLNGFKGRASRDNWVAQAKILANGGDTAFSKRVEDGDVY